MVLVARAVLRKTRQPGVSRATGEGGLPITGTLPPSPNQMTNASGTPNETVTRDTRASWLIQSPRLLVGTALTQRDGRESLPRHWSRFDFVSIAMSV